MLEGTSRTEEAMAIAIRQHTGRVQYKLYTCRTDGVSLVQLAGASVRLAKSLEIPASPRDQPHQSACHAHKQKNPMFESNRFASGKETNTNHTGASSACMHLRVVSTHGAYVIDSVRNKQTQRVGKRSNVTLQQWTGKTHGGQPRPWSRQQRHEPNCGGAPTPPPGRHNASPCIKPPSKPCVRAPLLWSVAFSSGSAAAKRSLTDRICLADCDWSRLARLPGPARSSARSSGR